MVEWRQPPNSASFADADIVHGETDGCLITFSSYALNTHTLSS
jgi:hypothetical protein